jgi:uncharacterized membrane protein
MNWLFYCFLTILLYGLHDVILKHFSANINPTFSSVIINLSAFIGMFLVLIYQLYFGKSKEILKIDSFIFIWQIVAGLCLGAATITFIKAFNAGGDFSVVLPTVYIGIILLSAIFGYFFFKETINLKQIVGIGLSAAGIYLLLNK